MFSIRDQAGALAPECEIQRIVFADCKVGVVMSEAGNTSSRHE